MPGTLLYLGRSEPVPLGAAERSTPDKWHQPQSVPVRGPRRLTAEGAGASPVLVAAAPAAPGADAYQPPAEYAPRRRPALTHQAPAEVLTVAPEATSTDRWQPLPELPTRPRFRRTPVDPAEVLTTAPEATSADRWQPPNELPLKAPRRPWHGGVWQAAAGVVVAEATSADRWNPLPELPTRPRFRRTPVDPAEVLTTAPEATSADRWQAPYEVPVRTRTRTWQGGVWQAAVGVVTLEAVTADRWQPLPELPLKTPRRPWIGGAFQAAQGVVVLEAVSADRFQGPYVLPVRTPRRPWLGQAAYGGEPSLFNPPEVLTLDKWFRPSEGPQKTAARTWKAAPTLGGVGVVTREAVSADRYQVLYEAPPSRRAMRVNWLAALTGQVGPVGPPVGFRPWFARRGHWLGSGVH